MTKIITAALMLSLLSLPAFAQHAATYPAVDSPPAATTGPDSASQEPAHHPHSNNTTGDNAQTCTDSCNRSYEGCMDHDAAIPGNEDTLRNSNNVASNLIGAASDCKDDLRSCLNQCGG